MSNSFAVSAVHNESDPQGTEVQNPAADRAIFLPPNNTSATNLQDTSAGDVVSPMRRRLLSLGMAACGAAACGTTALLSAVPAQADIVDFLDKIWDLDPIVLNFAWEMEELEKDFFYRVTASPGYDDLEGRERSVINLIARQDEEHFERLGRLREKMQAKGAGHLETPNASASRRPRVFQIPRMRTRQQVLVEAIRLKEDVLFAYHGAVPYINSKELLALGAAIAGVEGRHVAVLRELSGAQPVPTSFEGAVKPQKSGNRLARYGFKGGGIRESTL